MLLTNPFPLPRTLWGEVWRILAAAGLGALVLVMVAIDSESTGQKPADWLELLDLCLGLISLAVLPLRRRYPFPIALLLTVAGGVSITASGAAAIALISLATHRRWPPVAVVSTLSVVAGLVYDKVRPGSNAGSLRTVFTALALGVLSAAVCVAIGYYIGTRRALFASWQERAETAEREQASRIAGARANERARIAREMHDVLAHRISLVAMHSGALAYRTDLNQQETSQAAEVIRDNAHLALSELREVLGVLRTPEGEATSDHDADCHGGGQALRVERPQPTLADLDELLAGARTAGASITATLTIDDPAAIGDSLSRNAYRIVQELVTNARKHAPEENLELRVTADPTDGIAIYSRNSVPEPGRGGAELPASGMGLAGVTERAVLSGGTLTFGLDRRGDFVVAARLPWQS